MAKQKRLLVQTSFYVYVDIDETKTNEENEANYIEVCDEVSKEIEAKVDEVEQNELTIIKESDFGELKQRTIFYR
jgi:hypothetical protein